MLRNRQLTSKKWQPTGGSLDLDENFYGDQDFDLEEFDQEGFDMGGGEGSAAPFEEEKF